MAFDSARSRVVVFSGSDGSAVLRDTWEYDAAANAWTQVFPSGEAPAGRSRHEGTFVADLGATYFFGGLTEAQQYSNELWALAPGSEGVVNAASFASGPAAAGQIRRAAWRARRSG